eukprot:TRINITY_DN1413_c0_g1_i1.p1 TRINITY_DN1413_c0_g1~~TRINITY_DN1413_c0_g1_i1.p1  ORF type:complete len:402 (+),score=77.25 TRINITY_DN1413_c0_g1_i1:250-1455(+)
MAFTTSKVSGAPMATDRANYFDSCGIIYSFTTSQHICTNRRVEFRKPRNGHLLSLKLSFPTEGLRHMSRKPYICAVSHDHDTVCVSTEKHEVKECVRHSEHCSDISSSIMRLNDRARQDFAILGLEFLKLDARAREDTEKIDHGVKKKAELLHHIAMILKDKAQSKLKRVADQHWSDGALEADLRRADFVVRRRAMEDAFMALEFVRNIHNMMVSKVYDLPRKQGYESVTDIMGLISLEKNGKSLDLFPGEVSTDRITAIQDAYWSMASALSEADGIDYTNPDELELLVATLIDLDAMDGKSSVSLLAECSSSPDVSTRQALANALAAAPSMWNLGNAGMGALQRLAEDSNPTVAAAASKAIDELKRQWEIEEGDSWRFTMNQKLVDEDGEEADDDDPLDD